jgi:peroxiredoxin
MSTLSPSGTAPTSSLSIGRQSADFTAGFTEAIGPDLSAVFEAEQQALRDQGVPSGAVSVGTTVPDARLLDADGVPTSLAEAAGGFPAVLVFYRGAWCPYCNLTLKTYQRELLPALAGKGVALIAISPQTPEGTAAAVAGGELGFTVLSDPGNVLASRLSILTAPSAEARAAHTTLGFDVADSNADGSGDIPFPTVLVVDGERTVSFADVHVDYTTRTEVADILAAVDAL